MREARAQELDAEDDAKGETRRRWYGDFTLREHGLSYGAVLYRATFAFNGGLIYHGPGAGETFSVSLTPCLWGIHT